MLVAIGNKMNRRQVNHPLGLHLVQDVCYCIAVQDVLTEKMGIIHLDKLPVSKGKVVYDKHIMTGALELRNHSRTDKTCTTGNQNFLHQE